MTAQDDRRHFWRAHFKSPVLLTLHGAVQEAKLHDISLKGALVEAPTGWAGQPGDRCQLRLNLGADVTINMNTTVAHFDAGRVGLRCENIDLDSVTHLRRLVELNAGDPGLLDRELSALVHEGD
jgi:hypothetical protein